MQSIFHKQQSPTSNVSILNLTIKTTLIEISTIKLFFFNLGLRSIRVRKFLFPEIEQIKLFIYSHFLNTDELAIIYLAYPLLFQTLEFKCPAAGNLFIQVFHNSWMKFT